MAYTLVSTKAKNVGDFLIYERAKELLRKHTSETEYLEVSNREPLDITEANKTKALILCGGCSYYNEFYPGVYPFMGELAKIKVPIIPFGLGWQGYPRFMPDKFKFNSVIKYIIKHIHDNIEVSSCRDIITKNILNRHGIKNVVMTGDPAWYDLQSIGKDYEPPAAISKIVISNPQVPQLYRQSIELLKLLHRVYPDAHIYYVFHRGIEEDIFTPRKESEQLLSLANKVRKLGAEVIDTAFRPEAIEFYRQCDLHVGYRVHAHLYFLSIRKPSLLLQEDGRGMAMSKSLMLNDLPALKPSLLDYLAPQYSPYVRNILGATAITRKITTVLDIPRKQRGVAQRAINNIEIAMVNGIGDMLDNKYKDMVKFLETLP